MVIRNQVPKSDPREVPPTTKRTRVAQEKVNRQHKKTLRRRAMESDIGSVRMEGEWEGEWEVDRQGLNVDGSG